MDDKFYHGPAHGDPHFHSGPPGKRGLPGVSPTVQISELSEDGAYTITVTDAYHSESVRIPVADTDFIAERIDMWLDAHPEATTTVEDGSITIEKLTEEAVEELKAIADGSIGIDKLSSEAVEELTTIEDGSVTVDKLSGDTLAVIDGKLDTTAYRSTIGASVVKTLSNDTLQTNGKWLGGACYDSKRDRVVLSFGDSTTTSMLFALDKTFSTVLLSTTIACYHANDLEYIPGEDIILVTDAAKSDTLIKVNPSTLTVVEEVKDFTNNNNYFAQVSFDSNNGLLYAGGNSTGYVYDYESKEELAPLMFTNASLAERLGLRGVVIERQGSCMYNGLFTFLCDIKDTNSSHVQEHWLIQYDRVSNFVHAYCVESISGWEELEGAVVVDDVLYGLFQVSSKYLYVVRLSDYGKGTVFKGSYLVKENEDLNELIINSEYRVLNNTIATTLENAPVSKAFTLYNIPISNGLYLVQMVVDIDGGLFTRTVDLNQKVYGAWTGARPKVKVFPENSFTVQANYWTTIIQAADMPTTTYAKILGVNLLSIGVNSTDDYNLQTRITNDGLQIKASAAQTYTLTISISYVD